MARSTKQLPPGNGRTNLDDISTNDPNSANNAPVNDKHAPTMRPSLFLARWQLRQTWRLLLVTGIGMVAAVVLVCAAPLYAQIAMTAELRAFLNAAPVNSSLSNADIAISSTAKQVSPANVYFIGQQINKELQSNLSAYLSGPPVFSFQVNGLPFLQPVHDSQGNLVLRNQGNRLNLVGASGNEIAAHAQLLQGRFPQSNSRDLEVAITPDFARGLGVVPGSTFTVQISFVDAYGQRVGTQNLVLRIVGIFIPKHDTFWHGEDFQCEPLGFNNSTCKVLMSNDNLMTGLSAFVQNPVLAAASIEEAPNILWYYHMVPERIDINNLPDVERGMGNVLVDIANKPVAPPYVEQTSAFSSAPGILGTYSSHIAVVQIPTTSLSLLVVGLTLFFVTMMTDILVNRQTEAIAIMRSRGASRPQIIISLLLQSICIGLIALIIGPLIAVLAVSGVSTATLSASDQGALNIITNNPLPIAATLYTSAAISVGIAILAMLFSIMSATREGVLSMRREYARSTHRPIWQRLSLDVVAAIIALTGFAFANYETSPGVLDARVRVLVVPPLTLVGVLFLLLGASLLFLRFFPAILHLFSQLSARGRSATSMLALAQMARTPRQSLRMTMLLAFSIAFAIFALIFNASQAQRIIDVANHEVGADFSGKIPDSSTIVPSSTYSHIPGVISASVGYSSSPRASENGLDLTIQMLAVDADTYAQTAIWTDQNSLQPLNSLMHKLVAQRAKVTTTGIVPAIVDTSAASTLHLSFGSSFTLADLNGSINCIVVAEVERIPTMNDSTLNSGTGDYFSYGGILIDYKSYSSALVQSTNSVPPTTDVWLRTRDDAQSLKQVRAALNGGNLQLDKLNDRRAIIDTLRNDPLYLDLVGLLLLGAATAMLLALVGNLIASWLSVRSRLTNFAVLRALGTAPRQIAGIITWEQSIIYGTALVLGVVFGTLLSLLALPALVFTNVAISGFNSDIASGEYYILQSIPPVQIVLPPSLGIVFGGIVLICVLALAMMVRVASRPSISQTLRLNED